MDLSIYHYSPTMTRADWHHRFALDQCTQADGCDAGNHLIACPRLSPLWCFDEEAHAEHWRHNRFGGRDYCSGRHAFGV